MLEPRPRLLVLTSTYPRWPGDPEPGFVHELARRLVDRYDVTVLAPHAPGAARQECLDGVQVRRFRYAPAALETLVNDGGIVANLKRSPWKWLLVPGFLLALACSAWRAARRIAPAVVHAHWLIPQGVVALPLRRPLLVTSHGADLFALRAAPLQWLKRVVARRAGTLTVVSLAMREELRRLGVDDAKIEVQPMGVDLEQRFVPDVDTARESDEILFVGRLVEKKGLRHLIEAMPLVLRARPQARLTVVGFGPEEAERRKQAHALGVADRVDFIGAVPQAGLVAHYRRATVFVAPFVQAASGDQEGLGLVTVEAAGCGCRVVVGNVPAARDVLGGLDLGEIVDAGDPARLAGAVLRALQQPRSVDASVLLQLRERFGWAARAHEYARLLRALEHP